MEKRTFTKGSWQNDTEGMNAVVKAGNTINLKKLRYEHNKKMQKRKRKSRTFISREATIMALATFTLVS